MDEVLSKLSRTHTSLTSHTSPLILHTGGLSSKLLLLSCALVPPTSMANPVLEAGGFALLYLPAAHLLLNHVTSEEIKAQVLYSAAVAVFAFLTTLVTVPAVAPYFSRKGLKGRDMGRRGTQDEAKEM